VCVCSVGGRAPWGGLGGTRANVAGQLLLQPNVIHNGPKDLKSLSELRVDGTPESLKGASWRMVHFAPERARG